MKDTCIPEKCKLLELLGGETEWCPNYIEGLWQPGEGEAFIVKDCAPKRIVLMLRHMEMRMLGVQIANDEQRNQSARIMDVFNKMLKDAGKSNAYIIHEDTPLIEE